jgi:DMSO/TMAO reductase YedYZ molybdopterin-dependent catalytic subunit
MNHDPLSPHSHEPNPEPPSADPSLTLEWDGNEVRLSAGDLQRLPSVTVRDCYIISTGHGTTGPFAFTGTTFSALLSAFGVGAWSSLEVISADGFGTRLLPGDVGPDEARPPLLAWAIDGRPMTRADGLVRLVVPSETDDALKQVKWVARVRAV